MFRLLSRQRLLNLFVAGSLFVSTISGASALLPATDAHADNGVTATLDGLDGCVDKNVQPTIPQMQDLWNGTPYYVFYVYIGGSQAYCGPGGVTATWVGQAFGIGWALVPIWVGPQTPCTPNSPGGIDTNASTAYGQGVTEANAAVSQMLTLGLGSGVVFYDLEPYNESSPCDTAAINFMAGWTNQARARGYASGMYGSDWSICNQISNTAPDDVWAATNNGQNTVWNWPNCGNPAFVYDQRHNQLAGGQGYCTGGSGAKYNCDVNCANSLTDGNHSGDGSESGPEGWPGDVSEDPQCYGGPPW